MMEGKSVKESSIKAIDIVQVGMMAAMAFVVTYAVHIPTGTKAVLHLGDSVVFLAAILFGGKKAGLSAAIGMGLFDLLSPYAIWAPFTFVIKGVMGLIAGLIAYRKDNNGEKLWNNILGCALGGIWMIIGYYFAGAVLYHSFIVAIGDIPSNILQVAAGMIVALPLAKILKKANIR